MAQAGAATLKRKEEQMKGGTLVLDDPSSKRQKAKTLICRFLPNHGASLACTADLLSLTTYDDLVRRVRESYATGIVLLSSFSFSSSHVGFWFSSFSLPGCVVVPSHCHWKFVFCVVRLLVLFVWILGGSDPVDQ
jgi:hypothetical protein